MFLRNEQMQWQAQQLITLNPRRWPTLQFGNCEIDLLFAQQTFRGCLVRVAQSQPELWKSATMLLEQSRKMVPQNRARRGEPQSLRSLAPQTLSSFFDVTEKWIYELEQFTTGWRQRERPALKKFYPEIAFQLKNLAAHRRLLNAVRHLPHGFTDAAVFRDVIEKLEVMNVQDEVTRPAGASDGPAAPLEVARRNAHRADARNRDGRAFARGRRSRFLVQFASFAVDES